MMSVLTTSQILPALQVITDPKQIASRPDARVEKTLTIEKLYMTRQSAARPGRPMARRLPLSAI